jgi:hypothetical protein
MGATPPINHDATGYRGERMVEAHRFFSEQARQWLLFEGPQATQARGMAIETVVRELLQMVVIDLAADENAQEIFETLNARGAQLTAADLIKNFIFQTAPGIRSRCRTCIRGSLERIRNGVLGNGDQCWPCSLSPIIHLSESLADGANGEEIVAREIFDRFKRFADHQARVSMPNLLFQVHDASQVYRKFVVAAAAHAGAIDRLGLFVYRTGVLESEVVKPLLLCLLDPEQPPIPQSQLTKVLEVVESWMVRRMLVRATTKNYTQVVAELIARIRESDRKNAGDIIEKYLAAQKSARSYWPDDAELAEELQALLAYRRLRRVGCG